MPVLSDLSSDLAAIVDAAGRSVVRVDARRRIPASGIIWSADGTIVTANHVVQREENITVGLPDGSEVGATLAGRDPATDVAVLRLQSAGLAATPRASTEGLRVGHLVLALGRPGRTVRATLGIVSALGESWRTAEGSQIDHYLQTDAPFHPGFSGGPLVDAGGRVLGLNTAALVRGFSLTIPTVTLQRVVEMLLAHGRGRRGALGVGAGAARRGADPHRPPRDGRGDHLAPGRLDRHQRARRGTARTAGKARRRADVRGAARGPPRAPGPGRAPGRCRGG